MSAMDGLVEAQIPRLRRYARALTGDAVRADDLVQDTLERAWGRRHLWRAGTDLRAWLFTVMHNVFLNQQRGARPATDFLELDESLALPARCDGLDAQLELRDVAVGWALRSPAPAALMPIAESTLPQRAALAHAVYTPEVLHPVEVGADQEAHLVKWLSKRLDQPLKAPDLAGLGFRLVGGRLLPGGDRPAGQFMYENAVGRRLTLYVSADLGGNRETAFRFARERGASVFYWIDGPLGYALVADLDRGPLLQAAESVYRQIGN